MTFAQLRRLCISLPDVEERETWGEATFRVRERIFVMGSPEGGRVSVKASLDDQAGLVAMDPKTFAVSAYTGRYGWVTVALKSVGQDMMERLVTAAWKRTAPRRAVSQFEAAATSSRPGAALRSAGTGARSRAGSPRRRTPRPSR